MAATGNEGSIALTGFIIESDRSNYVRLVLGLDELSETLEIALDDVVEVVELSSYDLGASAVWVRRGAMVTHGITESVKDFLAQWRTDKQATVKRAGLRMRSAPLARDVCTCKYYCDGTQCVPCTCRCVRTLPQ